MRNQWIGCLLLGSFERIFDSEPTGIREFPRYTTAVDMEYGDVRWLLGSDESATHLSPLEVFGVFGDLILFSFRSTVIIDFFCRGKWTSIGIEVKPLALVNESANP